MRAVSLISWCTMLPLMAAAADEKPTAESTTPVPAYQVLRFDENYSFLTNQASRADLLDSLKYVPLRGDNPDCYVTFGGEVRERFESYHDQNFGIGKGSESHWLQRGTFLGDLHFGKRVRVFAEGISGLTAGLPSPAPPVQDDPIDLAYAFFDLVPYLAGNESLTLRGGRFGLSLGSGRLVASRAAPTAPNIPFRFDGFEMLYASQSWAAAGFITQPAKDSGKIDSEDHTVNFWGSYVTHWFDAKHTDGIDLYYLGISREHGSYASGKGDEHRHSFGAREFGRWNHWDVNTEQVVQAGTFGNDSILAWTASFDTGYTLDTMGQPRLGLKFDVISGDHDPRDGRQETFDALFPNPDYFNDASLLRPANFIDIHPNAGMNLTRKLSVNGGADAFWRYSRNDAVYAPPGFIAVPALKNEPAYVTTALDLNLQWHVQKHLTLLASYVHFFTGDYLHSAGGRDVDFIATTASFLF